MSALNPNPRMDGDVPYCSGWECEHHDKKFRNDPEHGEMLALFCKAQDGAKVNLGMICVPAVRQMRAELVQLRASR